MALAPMEYDRGTGAGNVTRVSGIDGTFDYSVCYKINNVVTVSGRIYGMTPHKAWDDFFVISEGYRPSAVTYGFGYMLLSNGTWVPLLCRIDNNTGRVTLGYAASENTTQVGFFATYALP